MNLEEAQLSSTDLESIAIIFDKTRELHKFAVVLNQKEESAQRIMENQHATDEALAADFDRTLTESMALLNSKLSDSDMQSCLNLNQIAILTQK